MSNMNFKIESTSNDDSQLFPFGHVDEKKGNMLLYKGVTVILQ